MLWLEERNVGAGKTTSYAPQKGSGFGVLSIRIPLGLRPLPCWCGFDVAQRAMPSLHKTAPAVESDAALSSAEPRGSELERRELPAPHTFSLIKAIGPRYKLAVHSLSVRGLATAPTLLMVTEQWPFPKRKGCYSSGSLSKAV